MSEHSVDQVKRQAAKELRSGVHSQSYGMLLDYAALLERQAKWPSDEDVDNIKRHLQREVLVSLTRDQLRAALQAVVPVQASSDRDAYEGAREDLLDWKQRAQRAEATLRSLGYTGVAASEAPGNSHVAVWAVTDHLGKIIPCGNHASANITAETYGWEVTPLFTHPPVQASAVSSIMTGQTDKDERYCVHGDRVAIELLSDYLARLESQASAVMDGYVLVPHEPTGDMILAGIHENLTDPGSQVFGRIYKAMLSAAPQPKVRP